MEPGLGVGGQKPIDFPDSVGVPASRLLISGLKTMAYVGASPVQLLMDALLYEGHSVRGLEGQPVQN